MTLKDFINEIILEAKSKKLKDDKDDENVDEMTGAGSVGAMGFGFPLGADPHPGRRNPLYASKPKKSKGGKKR